MQFNRKRRDFLKALIVRLADKNILVFEFIETWNKKEKANIDGFYLAPNMIVLKRHPSFSREIFTLAHELGHYLLREEEIEKLDYLISDQRDSSKIERWCNDFAYFFLADNYADDLAQLEPASAANDYHWKRIEAISQNTHLSRAALFTRLWLHGKLLKDDYNNVMTRLEAMHQQQQEKEEAKKQRLKKSGIKKGGSAAQPIVSPLFISTIQTAYYSGVLNEYEVGKRLGIKPEKLKEYIV